MSLTDQELIERLRRHNDAINRRDFDLAVEIARPDIVFVRPGAFRISEVSRRCGPGWNGTRSSLRRSS